MKKIFNIILGCMALLMVGACSDSQFDVNYANPAKTSVASCDRLMTGVFYTGRNYAMCAYARLFELDTEFLGHAAQLFGFLNTKDHAYAGIGADYNNVRWQNFYNMLIQYNQLKNIYNGLTDTEKAENKMYLDCATVYLYEQLEEMVDLWGDVPFSKAGTLSLTFDMTSCKPAYDKATDLYTTMLTDLKTIATELPNMTKPTGFSAQDYINNGDVTKWVKFANGLRMRMAMRIACQGSLAETGKSVLKEVFGTTMISSNSDEVLINVASTSGSFEMIDGMGIKQGWETWNGECNRASQPVFDALNYTKGEDITDFTQVDPRFQIMYDPAPLETKDANGNRAYQYNAMSTSESISAQDANYNNASGNYYAALDSATFSRNGGFINVMISAAEVDLTHAEAIVRGFTTGSDADAKAYFIKGVKESIKFYYKEYAATTNNGLNTNMPYRTITVPTDAQMETYAESIWDGTSTESKLKCICTQEWLNYSFVQTPQAYFNIRRTGYPEVKVVDFSNVTGVTCGKPIERFLYPNDEVTYNSENLKTELDANFSGTDSWYKQIFWSKPSWYTIIPANP